MKTRRLLIAAMWLNLLGATATAETMVVRPDPCPASADAPRIITLGKVAAVDHNPQRIAADRIVVLYPVRVRGWASARLLSRFEIEGEDAGERRPSARYGCR